MTEGLNERPAVAQALADLRKIVETIDSHTRGLKLPGDQQRQTGFGCLDASLEHQAAILALAELGLYGSMLALARVQYDAFIRGTWLVRCATPTEFESFLKRDEMPRTLAVMTREVEATIEGQRGVLVKFFERSKTALHGFTHTGRHAINRRLGKGEIGSHYSEADVVRAARLALVLGLLAGCEMAIHAGADSVSSALLEASTAITSRVSSDGSRPHVESF